MSNMYKTDPDQPRPSTTPIKTTEDDTVSRLELKVKQLTEHLNQLQGSLDKVTRVVNRQGTEISSLVNSIKKNR